MRIGCFNVLADCYSYSQLPSSTTPLPAFLSWAYRKELLTNILSTCQADLLCLQEIDHYDDFYKPLLNSLDYTTHHCSRTGSRQDGCLIAYKREDFELVGYEEIQLDDVASFMTSTAQRTNVQRFNVAQIALLQHKRGSGDSDGNCSNPFACSNAHLYWNPRRPEVKRFQTEFLVQRVDQFLSQRGLSDAPVFLAGDFNSVPRSEPYNMLTQGFKYTLGDPTSSRLALAAGWEEYEEIVTYGAGTKFLCDRTLSRLCRWLRVLGIDTALLAEPEPAETSGDKKGTRRKGAFDEIFGRARREKRVILTTSKTMRERTACPPSFLVSTQNLEQGLVEVIREHGLTLDQDKFLTVCGKCGGEIESCAHDDPRITGKSTIVPPPGKDLFCCVDCGQPYWWSENENSSPARAMKMADKLYTAVVEQLNVPFRMGGGDGDSGGRGGGGGEEVGRGALSGSPYAYAESGLGSAGGGAHCVISASATISATVATTATSRVTSTSTATSTAATGVTATISIATAQQAADAVRPLDALFAARNATVLLKKTTPTPTSTSTSTPTSPVNKTPALMTQLKLKPFDGETPEPLGIEPLGIEPLEIEPLGIEPLGIEPLGIEPLAGSLPLFRSAYKALHGEEAGVTNWSQDFRDALDYVFVSKHWRVRVASVVPSIVPSIATAEDGNGGVDIDNNTRDVRDVNDSEGPSQSAVTTPTSPRVADTEGTGVTRNAEDLRPLRPLSDLCDLCDLCALAVTEPQPSAAWPSDHFLLLFEMDIADGGWLMADGGWRMADD